MSGSRSASSPASSSGPLCIRRTSASVCRTERLRSTTSRAARLCCGPESASSARACPISMSPASSRARTSSLRSSSRSRFETAGRDRPTASATSRWVIENSSMRRATPRASSSGVRSSRWMFSMIAMLSAASSATSRTTAGTVSSPAAWAARQRRSPATSS